MQLTISKQDSLTEAGAASCLITFYLHTGSREIEQEAEPVDKLLRPTPSGILPRASFHLLKDPKPSYSAPPTRDKSANTWACRGHFLPNHHRLPT